MVVVVVVVMVVMVKGTYHMECTPRFLLVEYHTSSAMGMPGQPW